MQNDTGLNVVLGRIMPLIETYQGSLPGSLLVHLSTFFLAYVLRRLAVSWLMLARAPTVE